MQLAGIRSESQDMGFNYTYNVLCLKFGVNFLFFKLLKCFLKRSYDFLPCVGKVFFLCFSNWVPEEF